MTDNSRYKSGLFGEKLALEKMEKLGFQLVKTRYKTKYGEIDLIVENESKKMLVFVEVKRRKEVYDYENVITSLFIKVVIAFLITAIEVKNIIILIKKE